jgi:DNA anti-recombination protein RmuC
MATERRSKSASEILQTLHSLSLVTEEEILAMSRDEIQACLKEEAIDLTTAKADLTIKLNEIRGQQRLRAAREARLAQDSTRSARQSSPGLSIDQIRAEVQRRLGLLSPPRSPLVQTYFNRFKDMEDEDLPGLLSDLERLDELSQEGG